MRSGNKSADARAARVPVRNPLPSRAGARSFPAVPGARFLIIVFILAWAGSARAAWEVVKHDGRRYVPVGNVADFYKLTLAAGSGSFRLSNAKSSIEGKPGGRDIRINGVKYVLCFPIVKSGSRTLISAMDVTKIIEPVLRPQKIKSASPVRTVVLDAGHGGHDSGATGPFGREKDAALDVALRAKKLLEAKGYKVSMTRQKDVFIPLEGRSAHANRYRDAVFVSIHFNKSKGTGASGIETYCLAPRGVPSMDEENLSYSDFKLHPGHARDPENIALATAVHAAMVRKLAVPDRGIKRARFHVIRATTVPSILVEGGFMNSPLDGRYIASASYRQQMATAIAAGVDHFRSALTGQPLSRPPSAVASASDVTTIPDLAQSTLGADADASAAIAAAAKALAESNTN